MKRSLFPNQEIGSLAKPVWRIQALRGETVKPQALAEAKALAREFGLKDADKLLRLLAKKGPRTEAEKRQVRAFSSRLAIKLQEAAGLDLVYDGEQHRTEMYDYAVRAIRNFEPRGYVRSFDNRYFLKQAVTGPVALKNGPYHVDETRFIAKHAERDVKIPITGAYTLADWSFDEHYLRRVKPQNRRRREVLNEARRLFALDLARKVVRPNIQALIRAGAHSVQVDEPAATTKPHEVPLLVETFNESVKGLRGRFTMHICFSDYSLLFPHILEAKKLAQLTPESANKDASTLGTTVSHRPGFAYLELWKEYNAPFEVGTGVTDVHTDQLETPELVRDRILYTARAIGDRPEKVYVNPDCGLRTRTWTVARKKLEVQVAGAGLARAALDGSRSATRKVSRPISARA
jgi:5-methyltetrahydropteroyltriglutamate--homocysteine methyltransferase